VSFTLRPDPWISSEYGIPEVRYTSGLLGIEVGGKLATHVVDSWSKSVADRVRLSAWPAALWFATNWWRLRWEPAPAVRHQRSPGWRMAHELISAGHGFVWPHLSFASDGEIIEVVCESAPASDAEPIEYLSSFVTSIEAGEFERTVDEFIETVIARLRSFDVRGGDLHGVWSILREERASPEDAEFRRIEARLGFDSDEAPAELVEKLLTLRTALGAGTVSEIAAVCSGIDPEGRLKEVLGVERAASVQGRFDVPRMPLAPAQDRPWIRGRALAGQLRKTLNLGTRQFPSIKLAELLGFERSKLEEQPMPKLPIGVAIRRGDDRTDFAFRKKHAAARRFEAARWISEALVAPDSERWLASTDEKTARQRFQRAFAAELLSPIEGLREFLDDDYSDQAIDDAAQHFSVSPLAIKSHLANHGEIPREYVEAHSDY
jgi:hypothetical protein